MSRFDKYMPTAILQPYIKYFVVSENEQEQTYKVLPGTSLVMGFQYKGTLSYLDNNTENRLSATGITGLQDSFRIFKNSANTGTILVYFNDLGAAAFFRTPLHELFAQSMSLDTLIPSSALSLLQEQLAACANDRQRIATVEQFLVSYLQQDTIDPLVTAAVQQIRDAKGMIRIKELATSLYISQSPLEKRFRKMVGASPRKFASIVRLTSLIQAWPQAKNMTDLAYHSGYYDQSHFIKDFKAFTGQSPLDFFGNKNSPEDSH